MRYLVYFSHMIPHTDTYPITGLVHSIETLGAVDGPGLRTVVFFQGCPLQCSFCHNIDCTLKKGGTVYTPNELVEVVLKNRSYWESHGESSSSSAASVVKGGVTISGGEPTYQPDFLRMVLQRLHNENVHTAVDSCSVTSQQILDELLPFVDLWMLSIKHMDDAQHRLLTNGASNSSILDNIEHLDAQISAQNLKSKIRVRFLVIPGITDSVDHSKQLGKFVQSIRNLEVLEVLSYGSHGKHKWIELYGEYKLGHVRDATTKDVQKVVQDLEEFSLPLLYEESKS